MGYELPGIDGRAAIVTGAGRGIGRVYAEGLARAGAKVCVAEIDAEAGEQTAKLIREDGGEAIAVRTDVTSEEDTEALAQRVVGEWGRIDILMNNAAIWAGLQFMDFTEIPVPEWDRVMNVNLRGVYLVSRAVSKVMMAQESGTIINQSSIGGFVGGPLLSHYCTSKAAVNGLTRAMARDLGDYNVRVNAIAPGVIGNEATLSTAAPELLDMLELQQCIKRQGTMEDLVGALLFLASDASSYMTGQTICVDGGLVLLG